MANIRFEWDEAKNLANQRKHGIGFEEATEVFDDPLYMLVEDSSEYEEPRWHAFGMTADGLVLMVVHTILEDQESLVSVDIIRIISARQATRRERRTYESQHG